MSLPVMPPDPALNAPRLVVDRERRRGTHPGAGGRETFVAHPEEPLPDGMATVSVEAGTGAALADLHPVGALPLATALSRYREDD